MNREIKFRGKTLECLKWNNKVIIKKGDWVYGLYFIINPDSHDDRKCIATIIKVEDGLTKGFSLEVDPKTVGQYAVLTDFNEKEIYVGDIVTHEEYRFDCDDNSLESIKKIKGVVSGMDAGHIWIEPTNKNNDPIMLCEADNIIIIGNIHDNPELLEENNEQRD